MNRTLRRPMFRMGGSTNEGITSGLQKPRQGYKDPAGQVLPDDDRKISEIFSGATTIGEAKKLAGDLAYKPRGTDLNDFLINFGLDMVSRPKSGNILQQAGTSAQAPFKEFMAGKKEAEEQGYASESDMFKTLIEGAAEASSETGGKGWLEQWKFEQIPLLNATINSLTEKETAGTLTAEEALELKSAREQKGRIVQLDPITQAWLKSDDAEYLIPDIKAKLFEADQELDEPKYKGKNDIQLTLDAIAEAKRQLAEGSKDGGRIGYANGQMVQPNAMQASMPMNQEAGIMDQGAEQIPEEMKNIDFDTLRSRLPSSITDDIVTLIANSSEAMEDFAMIQSQQDIDIFNNKYSVELILPSEA